MLQYVQFSIGLNGYFLSYRVHRQTHRRTCSQTETQTDTGDSTTQSVLPGSSVAPYTNKQGGVTVSLLNSSSSGPIPVVKVTGPDIFRADSM